MEYGNYDQLEAVAQSCRHFCSGSLANRRFGDGADRVACGICRNWNGEKCVKNKFDNIVKQLELG